MILSEKQRELLRWYWCENRTITEIAELRACSYANIKREIEQMRAIFTSHGKELPRYNHGRPHTFPNLPETAVA